MIKQTILCAALFVGLSGIHVASAQTPTGAPTGSTGQCNDGSYSTAAKKGGACRGHQGVKSWFTATPATSTPAPAATAAKASSAPMASPAAQPTASGAPSATPAPGGGPGMVWVNSASNVYHCSGTRYYGTTKSGKYMSEANAKAAGARPDHGKTCGQ